MLIMCIKAFVVGGIICVIGQILIDKTKLTPAKILVLFVCLGVVLGGIGVYQKLVDFAVDRIRQRACAGSQGSDKKRRHIRHSYRRIGCMCRRCYDCGFISACGCIHHKIKGQKLNEIY